MTKDSKLAVGDVAPDFTLPAQTGTPVRLRVRLGATNVVLYFYSRDQTPGCTIEATAFRDSYAAFTAAGAEVIGVSAYSVASHRRIVASHGLPFLLLSDRDGEVRERYGVEKTLGLVPGRVTYVIDRNGVVRHVYSSQLPVKRHTPASLAL